MIGDIKFDYIGCMHIKVNNGGTIEKFRYVKWYIQLYLAIKSHFCGGVHIAEVKKLAGRKS